MQTMGANTHYRPMIEIFSMDFRREGWPTIANISRDVYDRIDTHRKTINNGK